MSHPEETNNGPMDPHEPELNSSSVMQSEDLKYKLDEMKKLIDEQRSMQNSSMVEGGHNVSVRMSQQSMDDEPELENKSEKQYPMHVAST